MTFGFVPDRSGVRIEEIVRVLCAVAESIRMEFALAYVDEHGTTHSYVGSIPTSCTENLSYAIEDMLKHVKQKERECLSKKAPARRPSARTSRQKSAQVDQETKP